MGGDTDDVSTTVVPTVSTFSIGEQTVTVTVSPTTTVSNVTVRPYNNGFEIHIAKVTDEAPHDSESIYMRKTEDEPTDNSVEVSVGEMHLCVNVGNAKIVRRVEALPFNDGYQLNIGKIGNDTSNCALDTTFEELGAQLFANPKLREIYEKLAGIESFVNELDE